MSKRKKNKLLKGKFYIVYTSGNHPSLIFKKNKKKNRYDAIVFGTAGGHHRTILQHPISPNVKQSVIHNRPIRGTRRDFGDKELFGLSVNKADKPLIKTVKRKKPLETKSYKSRYKK